jgi:DNA-binding SARP family transcriptional activator
VNGKEPLSLDVCVLGRLAVLRDGTRMQLPPSKKTRALLANLAVTARPHSRDRLCAMLWSLPDDPRAALRWSLSRLRPLVDEPDHPRIVAGRDHVGLDLDGVTVDILSLRNIARNGTDAIPTDVLREAADALEHDFLEGLDLPGCHEFRAITCCCRAIRPGAPSSAKYANSLRKDESRAWWQMPAPVIAGQPSIRAM